MSDQSVIRLTAFVSIFALIFLLERFFPKRVTFHRWRWPHNLGMVVLNTLVLKLLGPVSAAGASTWASANQIGFLHLSPLPLWAKVIIAILLLDLVIYTQHLFFHKNRWLWKLHAVHHTDMDYDLTTALRFHPIEILISLIIKMVAVSIIGAPLMAVIIFEVILNGMALFNHGNIRLYRWVDSIIRAVVVTPDMHRVHHSIRKEETNSNYGFNLSVWDKTFGTYREDSVDDQKIMPIGLDTIRDPKKTQTLWGMLLQPFVKQQN